MICKLFVVAVCVAVVAGQADKYPAGVNPHLCPNYPNCDNVLLAHQQTGQAHYAPAPVARELPAGVHPGACPNYPYCTTHGAPAVPNYSGYSAPVHHQAPVHHHAPIAAHSQPAHQYPAGVSPHTCPNYPYCH